MGSPRNRSKALVRPGTKVTDEELTRYRFYREQKRYSPSAAAAEIGRSKSWAYLYEKTQNDGLSEEGRPTLQAALSFVEAIHYEDERAGKRLLDRFGSDLTIALALLGDDLVELIRTLSLRIYRSEIGEPQNGEWNWDDGLDIAGHWLDEAERAGQESSSGADSTAEQLQESPDSLEPVG